MLYPVLVAASIAFTPLALNPAAPLDRPIVGITESCAVPNAPAVLTNAAIPEVPFMAQLQHATGTAFVQVDIDASGTLLNASIAASSGNPLLDREALTTTQLSQFRPAIVDCVPVGGTYLYEVQFPAD
jgi:TonB family protein